jgi:hypothetical protein
MSKVAFVNASRRGAVDIAATVETAREIARVYAARGYATNGADPITDADLAETSATAAEFAYFVAVCSALVAFMDGTQVQQAGASGYVDKVRSDL